jgi:monofunctional biosynthetic peptidoglycan transglycosylase
MRSVKAFLRVFGACCGWALLVCILWVLLLRFVPPPTTWAMVDQEHAQGKVQRSWRPLRNIAQAMPMTVIAAEDQRFFEHHGFDIEAMRKAMDHNAHSKRIRGASTISQQVAKNVFLWPGRNFLRKGLEAGFTVLIEVFWSKERILEVYLNVAETAKGCFGVEAVAQRCFKRSAARLTPAQCALIAAVLPSPRRFSACSPSSYVRRRQAWILRQMGQLGNLMDPAERARIQEMRNDGRRKGRR